MLNILCYLSIHQERDNSILLFIELFKFSPLPPMILHYRLWGWPCLWAQLQEIFWMLFFIFYVVRFTVKKMVYITIIIIMLWLQQHQDNSCWSIVTKTSRNRLLTIAVEQTNILLTTTWYRAGNATATVTFQKHSFKGTKVNSSQNFPSITDLHELKLSILDCHTVLEHQVGLKQRAMGSTVDYVVTKLTDHELTCFSTPQRATDINFWY